MQHGITVNRLPNHNTLFLEAGPHRIYSKISLTVFKPFMQSLVGATYIVLKAPVYFVQLQYSNKYLTLVYVVKMQLRLCPIFHNCVGYLSSQ